MIRIKIKKNADQIYKKTITLMTMIFTIVFLWLFAACVAAAAFHSLVKTRP